ncbi:uncharacterized protein DUF3291 [Litorimonas taeanensis]|uniref:Uncharacterized protein DUF3291 n=1 Tax=Litorimonas taeanensis TaxID=568099 RepID=A0A420WJF6_9PROT|nr:DUF3291 domain-containing protein [Litorimonas taeanensis]RKQ71062.1 uncharacterized protein DUF3291 [Litorimonas taeanensis]
MHLVQLNIAEAQYDMESREMNGFTSRIDAINAIADRAEGFVWRLKDDGKLDGALSIRHEGFGESVLINMSVWTSIESLFQFVYKTAHTKVMREERRNFHKIPKEHMVLWWVDEGHIPTLDEAYHKLEWLRSNGASPQAFSFALPFNEKGQPVQTNFPKKDCA